MSVPYTPLEVLNRQLEDCQRELEHTKTALSEYQSRRPEVRGACGEVYTAASYNALSESCNRVQDTLKKEIVARRGAEAERDDLLKAWETLSASLIDVSGKYDRLVKAREDLLVDFHKAVCARNVAETERDVALKERNELEILHQNAVNLYTQAQSNYHREFDAREDAEDKYKRYQVAFKVEIAAKKEAERRLRECEYTIRSRNAKIDRLEVAAKVAQTIDLPPDGSKFNVAVSFSAGRMHVEIDQPGIPKDPYEFHEGDYDCGA